ESQTTNVSGTSVVCQRSRERCGQSMSQLGARTHMHRRFSIAATAVAVLGMTASAAHAAAPGDPTAAAQKAADFVKGHPSKRRANSSETFHQHAVIGTKDGLQYVPYDRSYKGLKVRGGDFVVVTNANGDVVSSSAPKVGAINVDTTPQVPAEKAAQ